MKMRNLKNILPFWSEIIFVIVFATLLVGQILFGSLNSTNLIFMGILLVMSSCLIGQFFWKNKILSSILAFILGIASLWMILAVLSDIGKISSENTSASTGLAFGGFFFLCLLITAIAMPFKYYYGRFQ